MHENVYDNSQKAGQTKSFESLSGRNSGRTPRVPSARRPRPLDVEVIILLGNPKFWVKPRPHVCAAVGDTPGVPREPGCAGEHPIVCNVEVTGRCDALAVQRSFSAYRVPDAVAKSSSSDMQASVLSKDRIGSVVVVSREISDGYSRGTERTPSVEPTCIGLRFSQRVCRQKLHCGNQTPPT